MSQPAFHRPSTFAYLTRRLGKWQFRGLVAAVLAAVGGGAGMIYQRATGGESAIWGQAMLIGLAFLVAFVLFFWVRSFIKYGALAIVSIVSLAAVASWLTGFNIDLSRVEQGYEGASSWAWSQSRALLGLLTANWPGTIAAGLGSWLGLSRGR